MAGTTGLEPATSDVTGRRSNQLSYVPLIADVPRNGSTHCLDSAIARMDRSVTYASAGSPLDFKSVLHCFLRGLTRLYRTLDAPAGTELLVEISGEFGGRWVLLKGSAGFSHILTLTAIAG